MPDPGAGEPLSGALGRPVTTYGRSPCITMPRVRASCRSTVGSFSSVCWRSSCLFCLTSRSTIARCPSAWLRTDRSASPCWTYSPTTTASTTSNSTRPTLSQRIRFGRRLRAGAPRRGGVRVCPRGAAVERVGGIPCAFVRRGGGPSCCKEAGCERAARRARNGTLRGHADGATGPAGRPSSRG